MPLAFGHGRLAPTMPPSVKNSLCHLRAQPPKKFATTSTPSTTPGKPSGSPAVRNRYKVRLAPSTREDGILQVGEYEAGGWFC